MSILLALAAAASTTSPCAAAVTTIDINTCLAKQQDVVEAQLNRYYGAAVKRLRAEKVQDDGAAKALPILIQGQRAWLAYRDGECGAIEAYWSGGTIRTAKALTCRLSLTRLRVFSIWRDWLTYEDSSPPILPRPDLTPVINEDAG